MASNSRVRLDGGPGSLVAEHFQVEHGDVGQVAGRGVERFKHSDWSMGPPWNLDLPMNPDQRSDGRVIVPAPNQGVQLVDPGPLRARLNLAAKVHVATAAGPDLLDNPRRIVPATIRAEQRRRHGCPPALLHCEQRHHYHTAAPLRLIACHTPTSNRLSTLLLRAPSHYSSTGSPRTLLVKQIVVDARPSAVAVAPRTNGYCFRGASLARRVVNDINFQVLCTPRRSTRDVAVAKRRDALNHDRWLIVAARKPPERGPSDTRMPRPHFPLKLTIAQQHPPPFEVEIFDHICVCT